MTRKSAGPTQKLSPTVARIGKCLVVAEAKTSAVETNNVSIDIYGVNISEKTVGKVGVQDCKVDH